MQAEVRDHEPHLALFVEDDALLFYRGIAHHAAKLLKPNGWLAVECHCDYAEKVENLWIDYDFTNTKLMNDWSGLPRLVVGQKR